MMSGTLLLLTALLAAPAYLPVSRGQCFPLDELAPADRALAAEWLEASLDREALYTIAGDLKPISSGIRTFKFSVTDPDLTELDQARRIANAFRCGDGMSTHVQLFAAESKGERFAELIFVNRPALDRLLEAKKAFFAPLGLSPGTPPLQVLNVVEYLPRESRFRGLGYLFGFPDYAVDFFVTATVPGANSGPGKDRDFYSVPVYRAGTNYFVWAVPLGHQERTEDKAIAARAKTVLEAYRTRRDDVAAGKTTIADAVRSLLCDEAGLCGAPR
jgi:hypothetical protein